MLRTQELKMIVMFITLLLLGPVAGEQGWYLVTSPQPIYSDLETYPLEVKTDSVIGSGEELRVRFFHLAGEYSVGGYSGVYISFTSPPRYQLYYCTDSWKNFTTSLPSAVEKIWRIIFSRTSGSRLIVQCNDKEVLNFLMSDTTCDFIDWWGDNWRHSWTDKVKYVSFQSSDTASDGYRPVSTQSDGWYRVIARGDGAKLPYDLETYPLEVKTDSAIGSGDELRVEFSDSEGYWSEIRISFTSPPQYRLTNCINFWKNFETSLPSADEKIWRIIFSRTSGSRLIVQCNDKEVLNILMSDTTCYYRYWNKFWFTTSEVKYIKFRSTDTASHSFRSSQATSACTGLKAEWESAIQTTAQFPVPYGTAVEITCSEPYASVSGSNTVICLRATEFSYSEEPSCFGWYAVTRGSWTEYDLETFPLEVKTESVIGSGDKVRVWFKNSAGEHSGVFISFTSPPRYQLINCINSWTNFFYSLPSADEKIWRIIFSRTSGSRLIVQCNDKEVLNILMSDSTCSYGGWRKRWTSKVEQMFFSAADTASLGYKSSDSQ